MSSRKKQIRENFRKEVFARDGSVCKVCGMKGYLDAHHITDRSLMPNGGYVLENGITLCPDHHKDAEHFHNFGTSIENFSPEDLYNLIGSSHDIAVHKSTLMAK